MSRITFSRYWAFQAAGWGAFVLINTFFAYSFQALERPEDAEQFIGRLIIFIFLGVFFTHLMRFVIIQLNTLQKPFDKQILQFLAITTIFSVVGAALYVFLVGKFHWLKANEIPYYRDNPFLLILNHAFLFFIYFFPWVLIYFIYHYVVKSRKQQMDTLQLEALVKSLELQTIKAHINPHFIFNALNSIRALIDENPIRARTAVTELSNILRSSLKAEKGETVSFQEELKIVKDYLALEHIRFEDRLQVQYDVDEKTLACEVPPMMLQTLVENAIKHGISKLMKGGLVMIRSDLKENFYELVVQNTGHLDGGANRTGFGLSSTQDRLQLLYGDKARFEIKQVSADLVEAKILIPNSLN
ncbi:MAG: histidine kinase [Flaviaesturariibacter sp.]|nr:histidine kinase [Flaviaesturariibacter sp.]